jgi:hypothetical protein
MSHTPDYPAWPLDMLHDELRQHVAALGDLIAELSARAALGPSLAELAAREATAAPRSPRLAALVTPPPVGLGQTALTLTELITELGRFSASTWPTLARDDELTRLLDALQDLATRARDEQDTRLTCNWTPGHDHPSVWTTATAGTHRP